MLFKTEYGDAKLRYKWFNDDTAVDEFDTIILRAGFNQSWVHHNTFLGDNRGRSQFVRDQWAKDTQRAMGYPAPHTTYAHLYINGIYWGLYNPTERPTDDFAASYFGGDKDEYDVYNSGELLDGTADAWNKLFDEAEDDLANDAQYAELAAILDIDAYIDYMLINHYGANQDWDDHNWYATRRRTDDGKWQFYMWDSEFLFIGVDDNALNVSDGPRFPARLLRYLKENDEFRLRFADHIQRHFLNDGLLTPERAVERWEALSGQVTDAIVAESARWGDHRRDVDPVGQPLVLLERDVHWVAERNRLLQEYFPVRTGIVLEQYRRAGLFPNVAAPRLNQHGGVAAGDFEIRLSADQGTIYFTVDGIRSAAVRGRCRAGASVFAGPLQITRDTTVKVRVLHDGQWSALTDATFLLASDVPLKITEINYNPYKAALLPGTQEADGDNDRFEFIELMNTGQQTINLQGVRLAHAPLPAASRALPSCSRRKSCRQESAWWWSRTGRHFSPVTGSRFASHGETTEKGARMASPADVSPTAVHN